MTRDSRSNPILNIFRKVLNTIGNFFTQFFNRNMVDTYNHQLNRRTKNRDYD